MNVLLCGDWHGNWSLARDTYELATEHQKPDLLIQVGDFGYYPGDGVPTLHGCNHPCVFVDGNHEDHEAINAASWPQGQWEYMPRGTIRDGILYVGGAASVDKNFRILHGYHWSPLEDLTEEECDRILSQDLSQVKMVVSHTCPSEFDMQPACNPHWGGENKNEITRRLLQKILENCSPEYWIFGHWHHSLEGTFHSGKWICLDIGETKWLSLS